MSRKPLPSILPTTLWSFPSQHYGDKIQGDQAYIGATPSYIIWNLLSRYTKAGETMLDPFCGSGTSLDVAADLDRKALGFDTAPYRIDIRPGDARRLPLPNRSVDFIFMDPPYGDHIHYSDHPDCIGKLSAYSNEYFQAMDAVFRECRRLLRPGRHLGLYVCDFFTTKKGFSPVGFRLFERMQRYFTPVDIVSVVRHNADLEKGNYRKSAVEQNFYLRGFNYLFIVKNQAPISGKHRT